MKVAVLTNLYPPFVRGGAEYLVTQVVKELKRQGHHVSVVTSVPWRSVKSFRPQLQVEDGVRVWRFYPLNFYHLLTANRVPYPFRLLWQLVNLVNWPVALTVARVLQQERPDVVVSSNLMGLSYTLPRVLAKRGFSQTHILHDVQLLHPSGLFLWKPEAKIRVLRGWREKRLTIPMRVYQMVTRWLFNPVHAVVSPSAWLLAEHQKRKFFQGSEVRVLPNPVPPVDIKAKTKTVQKLTTLVYVGQFEKHKGVLWMVEALKKFERHDFVLQLLPLGQKPRVSDLRKLVGDDERFVIHDLVTQDEIDEATEQSHLSLIPSLCYENSPTAIKKSLAAGTPVLASRIGGIPELVQEGETGWLFTPGDDKNFLEKLTWCLDNPHALLQAGLKGGKVFSGRTIESYARELVNVVVTD